MVGSRVFRLAGALSSALLIGLIGACGGSSSSSQSPPSGSDGSIQISGREHFGWNQVADDIASYHFAVYVDNNRVELPATVCQSASSGGYDCNSPLPPLTTGTHVLEVVAWLLVDGLTVESARASALKVTVTGIAPSLTQVSGVLARPTSVPAPSSSVRLSTGCGLTNLSTSEFVMWDETGTISAVDQNSGAVRTLVWNGSQGDWVLSGLTVHPRYEQTHFLYVVELAAAGESALRLSRYREVAGVLGERAVLLQMALAEAPARTGVTFGPDGYLYVALLSSPHGSVPVPSANSERFLIRVTETGSPAPGDEAGSVFAKAMATDPVAFTWASDSGLPWVLTKLPATGYALTRLGQPPSSEQPLDPASAPIAMLAAELNGQQVLYIVGLRGDVRRLARAADGWTLRDGFPLLASGKTIRDALVLPNGDLETCGPLDGGRYGAWRSRIP